MLLARASIEAVWPAEVTDPAGVAVVSSEVAFLDALRQPWVASIHVAQDLLLDETAWPASLVIITHNLTIRSLPGAPLRLLNFSVCKNKMALAPEVHLSVRDIVATGLISAYWEVIKPTPNTFMWLRDGSFLAPTCSPAAKGVSVILAHPRPAQYPGVQRARTRHLPYCFRRTCFELTYNMRDVSFDRAPLIVPAVSNTYTVNMYNWLFPCLSHFSLSCVETRGYLPCRVDMLQQVAEGPMHTYSQSRLEVMIAMAVIMCGALLTFVVTGARQEPAQVHKAKVDSRDHVERKRDMSCSASSLSEITKAIRSFSRPTRISQESQGEGMTASLNQLGVEIHGRDGGILNHALLESFLSSGSYGRVYKGVWQDRAVAVKVVQHDVRRWEKISREVSISMGLTAHPNVVRTFHHFLMTGDEFEQSESGDFGLEATMRRLSRSSGSSSTQMPGVLSTSCIILELCDVGTLTHHLKQCGARSSDGTLLNMDVILHYALSIAKGMTYLHRHNICHGDLKSTNVLVSTDASSPVGFVAKVADFGLSRMLDADTTHVSTQTLGTITHMSPELLLENRLTLECDLYSFGIILWEMTSGEALYPNMLAAQVLHKVLAGARPEFASHVPEDFVTLASDCWAGDVATRPSFAEVVVRLQGMIRQREKRAARHSQDRQRLLLHQQMEAAAASSSLCGAVDSLQDSA